VDAESLALCAEGLLSRRRSERIRSHVASCPECAATQARLTEVPALLARVPPPSLPPGIAARLDAALSTEAARRAAQDPGTAPEHTEPAQHPGTVPAPRAGRSWPARPRGPRLRLPVTARVLATAGVLVVAGGVGYAVSQSSNPSSSPGSATAGSADAAQVTVRHSGVRYRKATLAAQASAVLRKRTAGPIQPAKGSGALARQAPSPALTGCLDKVAGTGAVRAGAVQLVDEALYRGHWVTVIMVRPIAGHPGTVYVAGAGCSAAHADILARVSLSASG
jgi:hypothetical protein